jgi:hypothetical protein
MHAKTHNAHDAELVFVHINLGVASLQTRMEIRDHNRRISLTTDVNPDFVQPAYAAWSK